MRLSDFRALSFDCYGTLIDWETGILAGLEPLLALGAAPVPDVLQRFAIAESDLESAHPDLPYPEILAAVHRRLAEELGVDAPPALHRRFGDSVGDWPDFSDSADALAYLSLHHRLIILSNVDRAGFARSNERLRVRFDAIYTAEDIGSYKPDPRNFAYLIDRARTDLGLDRCDILHTAQSLFHDHVPARRAGIATAWIDRRHDRPGWGATRAPEERPAVDFRFDSLADLVGRHRRERGET